MVFRFRPRMAGAVVSVVALAAAAASCSSSAKHAPTATSGASSTAAGGGATTTAPVLTASAPGIRPTTITIGLETDLTGVAGSTFSDTQKGAQARIDLQNAMGGVDGRKISLVTIDDQSNPTQVLTAAKSLVEVKNVFAVIGYSAFLFEATKYYQQQGIPVVGSGFDGPEWNEQPYTNMFSYVGTGDPADPAVTTDGMFLKSIGVTKLAGLGYGISPSASDQVKSDMESAAAAGIQNCYENLSVPFGSVDFTAIVLQIKAKGCDGVVGALVDASDVALSTALHQAGFTGKQLYYTGFDQDTLNQPTARQASQGNYYETLIPFEAPTPAVTAMINSIKQYDSSYTGGIPDLGLYGGWEAADLMIEGLKVAGENPTRQSFITNLRNVHDYTVSGLALSPIDMSTFGKSEAQTCQDYAQLEGNGFVDADPGGKPVCGTVIPNSYVEPSLLGK
jgi:branched-chain amino acid transport system substrate-binding protein